MNTHFTGKIASNSEDINLLWPLLSHEKVQQGVQACAHIINEKFHGKNVVLVCILKGAAYFFVDLTRALTIPHSTYFIEASSYHDSQVQSGLSILGSIEPSKFADREVILVDELFDNGHTLESMRQAIHEKADVLLEKIFTCTLFRKNKHTPCGLILGISPQGLTPRGTEYPLPNLYSIIVPDVWLVGYGLDDKQTKRNWPSLFAMQKVPGVTPTDDDQMFTSQDAFDEICNTIHIGAIVN